MTSWIHCNRCSKTPFNDKMRLWFASCGHLFCWDCLKTQHSISGQPFVCMVCHRNANLVEVNRHLKPELMALFRQPKDLIDEYSAKMKQIMAFQQFHRQRYNEYLLEKSERATKYAQSVKKEAQKSVEMELKLSTECDKLKAELERYKEHKCQLEGMLAKTKRELQHFTKRHHHRSTSDYATPATVADFPYSRRSFTGHSAQFNVPPVVIASSSSNTTAVSRRSFSYLSPATTSYNRSMGSARSAPLLPGRITKGPVLPRSLGIHRDRGNSDTESFGN
uniref:RING-type domain-containing protein n=1 Tax=Globodera rostochiensis TaxID=31243 RepID=A0A914GR94_GLORO